ncbi:M14 family zinc carboxypeptidase [Aquimarina muelleri]|uniref:M14 family zinc carboxypeptidase n=1 Tax=Aquimarina muelleri TaxID=279356 RepID=UPI003F68789E
MKKNVTPTKLHILWVCALFFMCSIFKTQAQEKYYRVVFETNKKQLESLQKKGLDVDHFHFENEKVTAEISNSDLKLLKENDVRYKILIRNLSKRIPKINKRIDKSNARKAAKSNAQKVPSPTNYSLGSMGGFHKHDEAIAALDKMRQLYPQLITVKSSIGTTVQGRSIYMVKISDNADTDENEDEMLFTSIHHAREPIGLSQNLFYMWYLLENYNSNPEIKTLVDNTELYFIPIVNPDGYIYNQQTNPNGGGYWRKNRRNNGGSYGIDLNRNYGYQWAAPGGSSSSPSSDQYHGPSKFSEPETQAMRDFTNQHNFVAALNYHSFSNLLIHPWGYKANTFTPDQSTFVKLCTYMTEENAYTYGTPNQTVGYTAGGSSDDWMYGEQSSKPKVFAMTPEVGSSSDGFWPASSRIIPLCNEVFPFNLKIMRMATKYAKVTPSNVNQTITTTTGSVAYSIKRFSLNQANWTVSLSSNSTHIASLGQPKQYNNITFLGAENGSINFELKTTTPSGTQIPVTITINNGSWEYTTNVTITYNGGSTNCTATVPGPVTTSNVTTTTASINWDAVSNATYDVRYRQTGTASWITSAENGTSKVITGLTASTNYEVQVRSKCADGTTSSYSASTSFTTTNGNPNPTNYCASNGKSTADEYISNVKLRTINKTSAAATGGYSDFTAESTELSKGSNNTITITPTWSGTVYNEGYSVWIDYNQDGDFTDAGEQVWTKTASKTTPVNGSFTVPATAKDGNTRMRVSMKYNGIPTSCESFSYGEVEDYTIAITGAGGGDTEAPTAPTGLTASNIAQTTVTLSWNAATDNVGITKYDVYQGNTITTSVSGTTANITGLTANTTYQFSIKAKDAAGNISVSSTIVDVTTANNSDPCAGISPYNSSTNYQLGDRVTYQGNLYERTTTGWTNLGPCGAFARSTPLTLAKDALEFYPNPVVGDFITVTVNNNLWKSGTILILDVNGNIVQEIKLKNQATQLDTSNFASGAYFIALFNGSKSYSKQMIIK